MSSFGVRTFSDGSTSPYFTLANEEYVRKFGWANGWNRIRIGILCAVQGNAGFTLTQNGFGIASSSAPIDNTQGQKSTNTTQWLGVSIAGMGYGNTAFTYVTGPPPYYTFNGSEQGVKRVNSYSSTAGNSPGTTYMGAAGGAASYRTWMFADFEKLNSTQWVMNGFYMPFSVAQMQYNITMTELTYGCRQLKSNQLTLRGASMTSLRNNNLNPFSELTVADSLSIFWSATATPLEVYGIAAYTHYYT